MNKVFKNRLEYIVDSYMSENYSEYKKIKSMPKGAGSSILFMKKGPLKFRRYIHIQYIPYRNYVMLNVQWSKLNQFPDELCIDPGIVRTSKGKLNVLKKYDEAWLSAYELDLDAAPKMSLDDPDEKIGKKLYTIERAKQYKELTVYPEDVESEKDFIRMLEITGWDELISCFGEDILDQSDLDRALGDLPKKIVHFISDKAIPYLESIQQIALS